MSKLGHEFGDFASETWGCRLCGCSPASIDARLACIGSASEPDSLPCDTEAADAELTQPAGGANPQAAG